MWNNNPSCIVDKKKLLQSLNAHDVRCVVIGAVAGVAHGYSRFTRDVDIFIEPTRLNVEKTMKALSDVGYDVNDVSVKDALTKKLLFRDYILRTDIHPSVLGVDFETVWKNRVQYVFHGEKFYFASLDDLIKMKKAAGRPRDLEDLRYLEEIKRQKEKK